jgi:hypothetical protein
VLSEVVKIPCTWTHIDFIFDLVFVPVLWFKGVNAAAGLKSLPASGILSILIMTERSDIHKSSIFNLQSRLARVRCYP